MLHTLYAIIDKTSSKLIYWGISGWTDDLSKALVFMKASDALACVLDEELEEIRIEPIEID